MDTKEPNPTLTAEELSAILAHEIKNPMNSVVINLEVLKSCVSELAGTTSGSAAEKARKYLDAIEAEVHRLDKVIKGFLEFANPSTSSKIKFKINPLLQELVALVQNDLRLKQSSIRLELEGDSPCLYGNSDQIKQAILNLVTNALQSFERSGEIVITSRTSNDRALISVKDNGSGISPAIRDKIFTPYFTTKAKGSGVGLFIVKRVMTEHNGSVEIYSDEGKGSEFTLNFPLAGENQCR
jgi:signal transduction histidine kinase